MAMVIGAAAYFFLVHVFFAQILLLPQRLAAPRLNRQGLFGRRISRTTGALLFLLFWFMGFAIWFLLCVVPITMYAADLNKLASPKLWFILPVLLGVVVNRFVGRRPRAAA